MPTAPTPVGTPTLSSGSSSAVAPTWAGDQPRNAGDLLWFIVTYTGAAARTISLLTSGWTAIGTSQTNSSNAGGCFIIYKNAVASGGDAAPTFSFSGVLNSWHAFGFEYNPTGSIDTSGGTPEFTYTTVSDTTAGAHALSFASHTNSNAFDEWSFFAFGGRGNVTTLTWSGGSAASVLAIGNGGSTMHAAGADILTSGSTATYAANPGANGTGNPSAILVGFAFQLSSGSPAVTANTSGSGTLTATLTPATSASAGLAGVGALSTTLTPGASIAAPLAGAGSLSASLKPAASTAGGLAGVGSLGAALTPGASTAGALAGTGVLTAQMGPALAIPGATSGSGQLSATLTPAASTTGNLSGDGVLGANVLVGTSSSAGLSGDGTLQAALSTGFATAGDFAGAGSLSATAAPGFTATPGLNGTGTLVADVTLVGARATGNLSGEGTLSVHLMSQTGAFVSLGGSGTLTVRLVPGFTVDAELSGSGTLESTEGTPEEFDACLVLDRNEYSLTLERSEYRLKADAVEYTIEMEHTVPNFIYSSTGDKDYVTGILSSDVPLAGKTITVGLGGTTPEGVTFVTPDINDVIDANHSRIGILAGAGAYTPSRLNSALRLQARVAGTPARRTVIDETNSVTFI